MIVKSFFFIFFWSKKEQKVSCQTDFQREPNIIERQISQNVTVLCLVQRVVLTSFWSGKNKT